MAVAFIREFAIVDKKRSTKNYDAINERLIHADAPEGLVIHYAGFDSDAAVFRIVNVWESEAQGRDYDRNHVMPAVRAVLGEDMGSPPTRETVYELHHVAVP